MITISASNLYMPMIWLYVFLQDFLIPFLCDPDLQCGVVLFLWILFFTCVLESKEASHPFPSSIKSTLILTSEK